jgi:hypothetical protein
MMERRIFWRAGTLCLLISAVAIAEPPKTEQEKYTLRYKFTSGETLRWKTVHRTEIRTTVSGTTQNVETSSVSIKAWKVTAARPNGPATFEHLVESVEMRNLMSGSQEVRYNSRTDKQPPGGFEDLAGAVGTTLSVITLDPQGKILQRQRNPVKASTASEGDITIPLPDEAVPVGHTWSFPHEATLTAKNGATAKVKTMQKFTLLGVRTGIATIEVVTRVLTPINDPALETQLLELESTGTVKFDIDAGRIMSQQMDVDKHVVGFSGEASSIHYVNRFTEELLPNESLAANRP